MNEVSLFTGAGGGVLGTMLLGFRHIAYVEIEEYCQRVLAQRIRDGILDDAPIFTDIKAFISSGCAELYRGITDIVSAGFPCQPFSVAGRGEGEKDERNMWPQTIECIRIIRPRYCLLENVPGLLAHGYIQRIFGDLAEAGYDAEWCVLGADDVRAPHRRKRLWILAYARNLRCDTWGAEQLLQRIGSHSETRDVAHAEGKQSATDSLRKSREKEQGESRGGRSEGDVSDTSSQRQLVLRNIERSCDKFDSERNESGEGPIISTNNSTGQWWRSEPDVGRVANELAVRLDFFRTLTKGLF